MIMDPLDQQSLDALTELLEYRVGPASGITIADIQTVLRFSTRRQTEVFLEVHLDDLPFAVCAGTTGYYRPGSSDELNHYINALRSRIKCIAIRIRSTRRAAEREGFRAEHRVFDDHHQQEIFDFASHGDSG